MRCVSSTLISELRTSSLGPKQYYELYMAVFDALRHLSVYLRDNHPVNHLADLYELVQYAGNIIPRLYLMITVGTVYMSIEDAPVKEIMKDMMEMSRGVQHPIRGLFLRYYLTGQARDYLPAGTGDGPEGNLQDSINFILTNFVEMNKLWVRLQHQGHSRERDMRTKERKELQLLVGSNLVRLSQLVDLDHYRQILHPLLEQVVQCKDVLAQEYLLEGDVSLAMELLFADISTVITQVFPDEYHLHTLDQFLSACARLHPQVNVKAIVIGLMDRLSAYAAREKDAVTPEEQQKNENEAVARLLGKTSISEGNQPDKQANGSSPDSIHLPAEQTEVDKAIAAKQESDQKIKGIPEDIRLFEIFHEQVMSLTKMQRLPLWDTIALLVSLTNLALNIYPDRLDYVDQVLAFANEKVAQYTNHADLHSQQSQSEILKLLLAPLQAYYSMFTALSLPNFIPLLHAQPYPTRRAAAGEITRSLLKNQIKVDSEENLKSVLEVLRVLIREGTQQTTQYPGGPLQRKGVESEETLEEQGWLARLVHLIQGPENDTQFILLQTAQKAFSEGHERIKHTYPPIIMSCFTLARKYKAKEHVTSNYTAQTTALYKFIHSMLTSLYTRVSGFNDMALRLYVACGSIADQTGHEEIAYESFAQAFTVYEEAISDSRAQFQAVCIIAGALHQSRGFGRDNYDTLITKCALHGSKLLKKPDQCRAVYLASHLWWKTPMGVLGEESGGDDKVYSLLNLSNLEWHCETDASIVVPRRQTRPRMPATRTESRGCMHGHSSERGTLRGDSEPLRVLFRSGE